VTASGVFEIQFDPRAYLWGKFPSCFVAVVPVDPTLGVVLCHTVGDVGVIPLSPVEFSEKMDIFDSCVSFLLDNKQAENFCKKFKLFLTLYFFPKSESFKKSGSRGKSFGACVNVSCAGDKQSGQETSIVLQVCQKFLNSPPYLTAWKIKENVKKEVSNLISSLAKAGPGGNVECLIPSKRPRSVTSADSFNVPKVVPHRKNNKACTNSLCRFCIERIPELAVTRNVWESSSSKPRSPLFNAVKVGKVLDISHRLRASILDQFFKDLLGSIKKAKDLSIVCFDVEALSLYQRHLRNKHPLKCVSKVPSECPGLTKIGVQIPVMIGCSYLDPLTVGGTLRLGDVKSETFELCQTSGFPEQERIKVMVSAWLNFLLVFQKKRKEVKKKLFQSTLKKLSDISTLIKDLWNENNPGSPNVFFFDSTFVGKLKQQLESLIDSIFLVSFFGSRYDLAILDRFIFTKIFSEKTKRKISIAKSGRTYKFFSYNNIHHVDLRNIMGGSSLDKTCQVLGVDQKFKISKGFQPFQLFTSLEFMRGNFLPGFDDSCFLKSNGKDKICTKSQYDSYKGQLSNFNHWQLLRAYLRQDTVITFLCFMQAQHQYREVFNIEILDGRNFTSSSLFFKEATVIQPFLNHQPSFVNLPLNSTIFYLTLNAISGGLVCKMANQLSTGQKLFPQALNEEERGKVCKAIHTVDFRSLYPSQMINVDRNCIGEPALCSPMSSSESCNLTTVFKLTSSSPVYDSEQYIMCSLVSARLFLKKNWKIVSLFHAAVNGEISLIPRNNFDFVAFCIDNAGKKVLFVYQYDGSIHAVPDYACSQSHLHVPTCSRFTPDADLLRSDSYRQLLKHGEWQKKVLLAAYGDFYDRIIYERSDPCTFHSPFEIDGLTFKYPKHAMQYVAEKLPKLNIVYRPYPRKISPIELLGKMREPGAKRLCYESGLICLSGHFEPESKFFDERFGLCIGKKKLRKEYFSPEFYNDLRARFEKESLSPAAADLKAAKYVEELLKEEKLTASHSFQCNSISLKYWEFLDSLGFKTTNVFHIVLYSLR